MNHPFDLCEYGKILLILAVSEDAVEQGEI